MSEIQEIPLAKIKAGEYDMRSRVDEIKMGELMQSIKNRGLIHPVLLRPAGEYYEVVCGMRRVIACLRLGRSTIRAEVREMSDDEAEFTKLSENVQREDVSPLDEAKFYAYLKRTFGLTDEEVARQIGKSRSHVTQRRGALEWPDTLRDDVELGELSFSTAMQLARVKEPEKQEFLRFYAKQQAASTAVVRYWVDQELTKVAISEEVATTAEGLPMTHFEPPPTLCKLCGRAAPKGAPWPYYPLCFACLDVMWALKQKVEEGEEEEE